MSSLGSFTKQPTVPADNANYSSDAARVSNAIAAANAQAANVPGPSVTGVMLQTARHKITGLVIGFNKALANASATNPANYPVHLMSSARQGALVTIRRAKYDASSHTVTLVLNTPLSIRKALRLRISGGSGGITDTAGNALGSRARGAAGVDYFSTLNPGA
jgi:hypothetical protein